MIDKRILVAGGAGSIGSELVRQLSTNNKIYILDIDETRGFDLAEELKQKGFWVEFRIGDIRNKDTVFNVFSDFKPQVVINAAALKHVSPSQTFPREYVDTNIIGNLNLLEESKNWECMEKFVFISTDKAINEVLNVMGATKRCSEGITRSFGKGYLAVRFGNVMHSRGSVLEIWNRQFTNKEELTITDPTMKRFMMTIGEACKLVIEAAEIGEGGEVFIFDMGEPKNILDLKNEIYGNYPYRIIGIRPGEQLEEKLMTSEEERRAIKSGRFFIVK